MACYGNRKAEDMEEFWISLPTRLKMVLYKEKRWLITSSDEVPVIPIGGSRIRSLPKYYLFNDILAIVQGTVLSEYPLKWVWLEHIISSDAVVSSAYHMTSFRIILPEINIDLQCKEFAHKSMWVSCIVEAVGVALNIPQFINSRGDLTLDTQLQLIRGRDFMEYTFSTNPELKDARYKGQWLSGKPHGSGELWHEPSGKLYKGGFRKGIFHGKGELLWFADCEDRKKYIGDFSKGSMDGQGEMKYSNGDVYDGHWSEGKRNGYGTLEEASRKNSKYSGGWKDNKRNGYGIYDDRMKHERYLGMWLDGQKCGPGIMVTSSGTYCEGTFFNGMISSGNDGLILDPNGSSYMGKLGPDFRLAGKGILTLNNGVVIDGSFTGQWHGNIEIQRGTFNSLRQRLNTNSGSLMTSISELQVAKLDRRIGTCTVLASNKWQPIYEECETMLGFSGNAASDVITAWSRIASGAFDNRRRRPVSRSITNYPIFGPSTPLRRASSLSTIPKTVRTPGNLIPLERARAMTIHEQMIEDEEEEEEEMSGKRIKTSSLDTLEKSLLQMSIEHSIKLKSGSKVKISGPLHLQDEMICSYPPVSTGISYTPDSSPVKNKKRLSFLSEEEKQDDVVDENIEMNKTDEEFDSKGAIQKYIDKAFNTSTHPLGILMNNLESVFRDSYGGIGANQFLLVHAISEIQYIIKRLHGIIRILFPFLDGEDLEITNVGFSRVGMADPDDYLCIDSGYELLHPLVFLRIFPTLIMLYILHHAEGDRQYGRGIEILSQMDNERLVHFIHLPKEICRKLSGPNSDGSIIKDLDEAARILQKINTLYTPGEFLDLFKSAFQQLSCIEQLTGDLLLPSVVYIVVRANVSHLGAYLHFLTDFAHTQPEDEYTLVTYEAAYNFIRKQDSPVS